MSKILIIEDNQGIRENLEELLELSNYKVILAKNGKEGIKQIHEVKPDLILCDIAMPKLNGFQVLEYVRTTVVPVHIPFIFITSSTQKQDIKAGKLAGADAYLTKPFSKEALFLIIEKYIV